MLLKEHGFEFGFYEAPWKHSYVRTKLTDNNLHMVTDDQDFLNKLVEIMRWHINGVHLLNGEAYEFLGELSNEQ